MVCLSQEIVLRFGSPLLHGERHFYEFWLNGREKGGVGTDGIGFARRPRVFFAEPEEATGFGAGGRRGAPPGPRTLRGDAVTHGQQVEDEEASPADAGNACNRNAQYSTHF